MESVDNYGKLQERKDKRVVIIKYDKEDRKAFESRIILWKIRKYQEIEQEIKWHIKREKLKKAHIKREKMNFDESNKWLCF